MRFKPLFSTCIFLYVMLFLFVISNAQIGYQQKGLASFYHDKFHGRRTSSGERFNQNKFTGAHRKLLFNTMVKVTNLQNDKSVVVRINDRGPYKYKGRIIDLTLAAAKELKIDKQGLSIVKLEVIGEEGKINYASPSLPGSFEVNKCYNYRGEVRNPKGYGVQVAAFAELVNAKYFAKEMFREGYREIVLKVMDSKIDTANFKVIVGEYKYKIDAQNFSNKLKNKDFYGFVVKY